MRVQYLFIFTTDVELECVSSSDNEDEETASAVETKQIKEEILEELKEEKDEETVIEETQNEENDDESEVDEESEIEQNSKSKKRRFTTFCRLLIAMKQSYLHLFVIH